MVSRGIGGVLLSRKGCIMIVYCGTSGISESWGREGGIGDFNKFIVRTYYFQEQQENLVLETY